jgi:preprotein translocase subunit SecE
MEKSKVSAEAILKAEERAKSGMGGESFQPQLDLSNISQEAPRGEDEGPAMFYDPENEMTEEEMKEADPDSQMSIPDQAMKEINAATWPAPDAALKEVGVLIAVVIFTAALIIGWDNFLRETYTSLGFIPTNEDIMKGAENMVLPDGWTKGMSEDDFMSFQDEVGSAASEAGKAASSASSASGFPKL